MTTIIKNIIRLTCAAFLLGFTSLTSQAQFGGSNFGGGGFNNYGGGYNNYGGGYNNYGGGYGGSSNYGGGMSGGMGNSRFGGGMSGGMGNSRFGGGMSGRTSGRAGGASSFNQGGYSSMQGGYSTQGRTSSRGGYNQAGMNQGGYNNYNQGGYTAAGRGGRNTRSGGNIQNFGAPTSQGQQGVGQTAPTGGGSTERRSALRGGETRGALAPSAGGGGAAADGGIQIQGASGPPAGAGAGQQGRDNKPAGRGTSTSNTSSNIRPTSTLYMDTDRVIKVLNQPFPVDFLLSNPNKTGFDEIEFTVRYNPNEIIPVQFVPAESDDEEYSWEPVDKVLLTEDERIPWNEINPSTGLGILTAPKKESFISKKASSFEINKNSIDEGRGLIRFSAKAINETSTDSGMVARVHFMPIKETKSSNLSFVFLDPDLQSTSDFATSLTLNGEDQLGSKYDPTDGTTSLNLQIYETLDKAERDPRVVTLQDRFATEKGEIDFGTHIYLLPREKQVDVGDVVEVDIYLANPQQEPIDTVNLLIAYNPRIFQPLDADDFHDGINLDDRSYKAEFPFDFPVLNLIDPEKGIIDFRKKAYRAPIKEEGVFATIKFRAMRPTNKTTFRIFLSEDGEAPTTGVFFRNQDKLGDPADSFDGVTTASLEIRPTVAYLQKLKTNER